MRKTISDLPFHLGFLERPRNPDGVSDTLDFHYSFDQVSGVLRQEVDSLTLAELQSVYSLGIEFATPLSPDEFGAPHLIDFADYVLGLTDPGSRILEIGVGRGHLSHRLLNHDRKIIGIEPGKGFSREWDELGITVVVDFFPSAKITGAFDAIVSYGVLEHVLDPVSFLRSMASRLTEHGKILLSVPDCSEEIDDYDASMFVHEHLSYFSIASLQSVIRMAGLHGKVVKSGYGRCLYAVIQSQSSTTGLQGSPSDPPPVLNGTVDFLVRTDENIRAKRQLISGLVVSGTVGIFAPGRALPYLLTTEKNYRFFDDDPRIQGKHLVPFPSRVESRNELIDNPVDTLIIASRTFGRKIMDGLNAAGYQGRVLLLWEGPQA